MKHNSIVLHMEKRANRVSIWHEAKAQLPNGEVVKVASPKVTSTMDELKSMKINDFKDMVSRKHTDDISTEITRLGATLL